MSSVQFQVRPLSDDVASLRNAAHLRLAVAFLGSRASASWWNCDFLSEAGLASAEYNFPRHPLVAALGATTLAAKLHHDERIGKSGIWHLFRLPTHIEVQLHQQIASTPDFLMPALLEQSAAMSFLAELADGEIDPPDGPVQVGSPDACASREGISEMAKHYHAAFRAGRTILPYFATSTR
jgi:hypothetical protein